MLTGGTKGYFGQYASFTVPVLALSGGVQAASSFETVILRAQETGLGLGELSSGQILLGATRLLAAGVILIELAFGAFLGAAVAGALWKIPPGATSASLGPGQSWPAVVALGTGLSLLFQVRPQEFWLVAVGSLLAWCGVLLGGKLSGSGPGDFFGALLLGLFANACGLHRKHAPTVILLPTLMVLAPGYASYLDLGKFQTSGVDAGFFAEFQDFINIAWIIAGLFVANTLVPSAGSRRRMAA